MPVKQVIESLSVPSFPNVHGHGQTAKTNGKNDAHTFPVCQYELTIHLQAANQVNQVLFNGYIYSNSIDPFVFSFRITKASVSI